MNRDYFFLLLIFFLGCFSVSAAGKKNIPESEMSRIFYQRQGLPNFFLKAERGDTIRVAYFGGSITAQHGWRIYSMKWFRKQFPKAHFVEINAAIGGTGSDFGVFRLRQQVLSAKPDLLFVEFAVNDSGTKEELIRRSMEGIVRQSWVNNPLTDICFVYTIKESFLQEMKAGSHPVSVKTMEEIAGHYGIPSVNFGEKVFNMVEEKKLVFSAGSEQEDGVMAFSQDGVHPYPETGQRIYQEVLKSAFEMMLEKGRAKSKKHKLPSPLDTQNYSATQMLDWNMALTEGNWETIQSSTHPVFNEFSQSVDKVGEAQGNATLSLKFKGNTIGFYDLVGPGAGRIVVEIDGCRKDTITRFDEYCTYWRINYFLIDNLENKEHRVVVRVLPEAFDKAAILAKRNDVIGNPADYESRNWYPAKILVNGSLIVP